MRNVDNLWVKMCTTNPRWGMLVGNARVGDARLGDARLGDARGGS